MSSAVANMGDNCREDLFNMYDDAVKKLKALWNEIGLDEESQALRSESVNAHLKELLEQMVSEEEELKQHLVRNIEELFEQLKTLSKELGMEPHKEDVNYPLIVLEQQMKEMVADRTEIKKKRLAKFGELRRQERILCDKLGERPASVGNSIPNDKDMQLVSHNIENLTEEMEHRKREFLDRKDSILKLMKELDMAPFTALEREVATNSSETFVLHQDKMKALQDLEEDLKQKLEENKKLVTDLIEQLSVLWNRIEMAAHDRDLFLSTVAGYSFSAISKIREEIVRCEELKRQNLATVIQRTHAELQDWWERCLIGAGQQIKFDPAIDVTEERLVDLENEVERLKTYFNECRDIFTLYARHEKLWHKMKVLEECAHDPGRLFKNRGGNLLLEEKERKKIQKELPQIEENLKVMIGDWEAKTGNSFLVWGQSLTDRLNLQWMEHLNGKEQEKLKRQEAREKMLKEEVKMGSQPAVPLKRRLAVSPAPSKLRKMDLENRSKLVASRMQSPFKRQAYKRGNRSGQKLGKSPNSTTKPMLVVTPAESLLSVESSYTDFQTNFKLQAGTATTAFLSSSNDSGAGLCSQTSFPQH